ncbi:MAG: GDP-mannose 4,6-dehydratase, partial [Clostridioides sp.]|nr:GDP-mannose 4,6-dehydratase [Clostridioides sp.]
MNNKLQFSPNTKFLITGGAGFIGSNLAEAILKAGYYVRILDNFSTGKVKNIVEFYDNPKFEQIMGDIRDRKICKTACSGIDYVLHHAAMISVPESLDSPLKFNDVNVNGHLNMMEASKEANVKSFVFASSSAVYGDCPLLPQKEDVLGCP